MSEENEIPPPDEEPRPPHSALYGRSTGSWGRRTQDPVATSHGPRTKGADRRCPACGTRVAAKATTCLMCGAALDEEKEGEAAEDEGPRRRLPGWVETAFVVVLALAILIAGGLGLYTMLADSNEAEEASPTATPTLTPTATSTSTPTQTPTPTLTPTPLPPRSHEIQEGETLSDIAAVYDITVQQILALNPDLDPEVIKAGEILLIPAATPTPAPTSSPRPGEPTPTPRDFKVHVVKSGETLISIAEEYGVEVSLIRAANDLAAEEETIREGQSLVIPLGTPEPSPTPTENPNATPTPIPPYQAPPLLNPPDGAVFKGSDEPILLQWASVSVLRDDEWYELRISQPGGVLSKTIHTRTTAWQVPLDLLSQVESGTFRWRVQVVREVGESAYERAGVSGETRAFIWQGPTATPGASLTPTP